MNILTNGQWKEFIWNILSEIDINDSKFEIPNKDSLNRVAQHALEFLNNEYPNMDPSGVKIASSLAYYFNALRPVFYKEEYEKQKKKEHKDFNGESERAKLNAVVATALARAIVAFSYKKHGSIGCNVNRATIQEWQRLLVKRHYDENGFNKIERLSHFAMILSLSKFLDGQFPGRQTPW